MADRDFGATHGHTVLVEDENGTVSKAYYEDGTWWLGWKNVGVKEQLMLKPIRLYPKGSV